jgi:hypothetical protein
VNIKSVEDCGRLAVGRTVRKLRSTIITTIMFYCAKEGRLAFEPRDICAGASLSYISIRPPIPLNDVPLAYVEPMANLMNSDLQGCASPALPDGWLHKSLAALLAPSSDSCYTRCPVVGVDF